MFTKPFAMKIALLGLAALALPFTASATHFRYGQLSWRTVSKNAVTNQYVAEFDFFAAFRRTGYGGTAPDGAPAIGDIITETVGGTGINYGNGSSGTLRFYVLNIDPAANWLYAVALAPGNNDPNVPLTRTYNGPGPWIANIDSCCRISNSVNAPDGSYRVETIVDFNDTDVSPTSTLPIIVQCPALQICNVPVPAADPENQTLAYRLATPAESGMNQPTGLTVSSNGLLSWNTPNNLNRLYSAQVVVEKRDRTNPANLLTKVSVDFLIQIVPTTSTGQPPSFQSPTPTCGQQITVQPGSTLQFGVSARTNNSGNSVTLNVVGQPAGAIFNPSLPTSGSPAVNANFTFTPTVAQAGTYQMNFIATDAGLQTTCGYSLVVPAPNTIVSLSGIRGGTRSRLQWKVSGILCGTPTYEVYQRVAGGTATLVATTSATAWSGNLSGPTGTLNEFFVVMKLGCAPDTQSNTLSYVF